MRLWAPALFAAYLLLFAYQEAIERQKDVELTPTLPITLHKTQGYLRQLGAEMLYIKAAVFLGGRKPGTPPESYAGRLASHFDVMAALHPRLLDIYYLSESSLSWINMKYAQRANNVLEQGIIYRPEKWVIPFFIGFNQFYYLHEFSSAAKSLKLAAQIEGGPGWLGHLSAVLAARGGDILGGLVWLRAMLATEEDATARTRYISEIAEFEKAAQVLQAISAYQRKYGADPENLQDLEPEFIEKIPQIGGGYVLRYEPPKLHLERNHAN